MQVRLVEHFHSSGINMRLLGYVYDHMCTIANVQQRLCDILLIEACARVLKSDMRQRLRARMQELKLPAEVPYRKAVTELLNLVMGEDEHSVAYWTTVMLPCLRDRFGFLYSGGADTATAEGAADPHGYARALAMEVGALRRSVFAADPHGITGAVRLFQRFREMTGVALSMEAIQRIVCLDQQRRTTALLFTDVDVLEIGERVKHMNIVENAEGRFFQYRGIRYQQQGKRELAQDMFVKAVLKFEEALSSDPNNSDTLFSCAAARLKLLELAYPPVAGAVNVSAPNLPRHSVDVLQTDQYFQRALDTSATSPACICSYAEFLIKCGRLRAAEEVGVVCRCSCVCVCVCVVCVCVCICIDSDVSLIYI
jgi:Translation initiation factor eIF3 subunit 135